MKVYAPLHTLAAIFVLSAAAFAQSVPVDSVPTKSEWNESTIKPNNYFLEDPFEAEYFSGSKGTLSTGGASPLARNAYLNDVGEWGQDLVLLLALGQAVWEGEISLGEAEVLFVLSQIVGRGRGIMDAASGMLGGVRGIMDAASGMLGGVRRFRD